MILVKVLIDGVQGPLPCDVALNLWLQGKVELSSKAEFRYESWQLGELETWTAIIKAVEDLKARIPSEHYRAVRDALDAYEAKMFETLKPVFAKVRNEWLVKDVLLSDIAESGLDFGKDPERRLRSIASKGWLEKRNLAYGVEYRVSPALMVESK